MKTSEAMLFSRDNSLMQWIRVAVLACAVAIITLAAVPVGAADPAATPDEKDYWSSFEGKGSTSDTPAGSEGLGVSTFRMIGSTALVLALIVLIAYLARRFAPRSAGLGRSDVIHVVGTKMLGGRKTLMLVRVRGQTLLLGITPQSIQCLTEIHEVEGEWAQPADSAQTAAFDRQLGSFLSSQKPS